MNKIRQEETRPVLVLDAGAMLFANQSIVSSQVPAKTVQAEGIMDAMARIGYDAFGLAPQDLAAGSEFLLKQPPGRQLPWLSANLVQENGQKLLFAPYSIQPAGNLSVGIIALTGTLNNNGQDSRIPYRTVAWETVIDQTIAQVRDQTDMIILLSSLTEQTNRTIARKYQDINLILQSGHTTASRPPRLFGNALITQIGSQGKHVGRLDIDWKSSGTWKQSVSSGIKPIRDRLDRINWQIGRLEKRYAANEINNNQQYKQLLNEKNSLTEELQERETLQLVGQSELSTFKSSFISLPVSLPVDQEIEEIVRRTKQEVNETNKRELAKMKKEMNQANHRAFANMTGWQACQSCHPAQTEFWQSTGHAKAWQTLVKANQQFNPDCLICHVTLPTYDKKEVVGQNLLVGLDEKYKTISCETCHGPSRDHSLQPDRFRPAKPDEKTCRTCHTPERDENFDYSEKLKKIRCPKADH